MAKSNGKKRKTVEYGRYGYFFIAPFFIVFAIFQLWPLIYTMGLAFCENYTDTMFNMEVGPTFNGLENFGTIFVSNKGTLFDTYTFRALGNTIIMWMMNFLPQILLALLLAVWFTERFRPDSAVNKDLVERSVRVVKQFIEQNGNRCRRNNIRHKSQNLICALCFQFNSGIRKPDRQKQRQKYLRQEVHHPHGMEIR